MRKWLWLPLFFLLGAGPATAQGVGARILAYNLYSTDSLAAGKQFITPAVSCFAANRVAFIFGRRDSLNPATGVSYDEVYTDSLGTGSGIQFTFNGTMVNVAVSWSGDDSLTATSGNFHDIPVGSGLQTGATFSAVSGLPLGAVIIGKRPDDLKVRMSATTNGTGSGTATFLAANWSNALGATGALNAWGIALRNSNNSQSLLNVRARTNAGSGASDAAADSNLAGGRIVTVDPLLNQVGVHDRMYVTYMRVVGINITRARRGGTGNASMYRPFVKCYVFYDSSDIMGPKDVGNPND